MQPIIGATQIEIQAVSQLEHYQRPNETIQESLYRDALNRNKKRELFELGRDVLLKN